MKSFRQNEREEYICEECERSFSLISGLISHVARSHNGKKEYYNKWIKEAQDGLCLECRKEVILDGTRYLKFCSSSCSSIYNLRKNGSPFSNIETKIKSRATLKSNYGKDYFLQTEVGKSNISKKNKLNAREIQSHIKTTNLIRYGVENVFQSNIIKIRSKNTLLKKYGVENISQLDEVKIKKMETSFKSQIKQKLYKDTNLIYQASYELDFLDKYFQKYSDIIRGPSIRYFYDNKRRLYFSDFYIPSLNLIIEIKNSWLATKDREMITEKEKAVINNGYKFLLIVDKDYREFNKKYLESYVIT